MTAFRPIRPDLDPGFFLSTESNVVPLHRPATTLACHWSVDSIGHLSCRWERVPARTKVQQSTAKLGASRSIAFDQQ
jgi:hypothetical protein